MAEDKAKDKSKPKKKPAGPPAGPPEPDMDEEDPMQGGPPGMPPGMGTRPPMPGQGVDPYAALAGMTGAPPGMGGGPPGMGGGPPPPGSAGMGVPLPMDMPMPMGPGGEMQPGAAGPMGMGNDINNGMMPGGMPGQAHGDELTAALMGELNPNTPGNADMPQHVFDPGQMDQQGISLQQLLQMLMLQQGGIPGSGVEPNRASRNVGSGIYPGDHTLGVG
jgi:hypothetical protein